MLNNGLTPQPEGLDRAKLFSEMVAFYATALEYPTEVFSEEVELEAELGIDSVKQTELLSQISQKYDLPPRPADFRLGDYPKLGQLVDFIFSRLPQTNSRLSTPPTKEAASRAVTPDFLQPPSDSRSFGEFWEKYGASIMGYIHEEFEHFLQSQSKKAPTTTPPAKPTGLESIVKDSVIYTPPVQPPANGFSRAKLFNEMVAFYAAALEYPTEVFSEEVELEAELGIDSVKQTELLAQISQKYDLPPRPADFRLGDYPKLGQLVDFIFSRLPNQPRPVLLTSTNGNGHHH